MPAIASPMPLAAPVSDPATDAVHRRIARRILPLLGLVWFIALIDRANLSFARIDQPFMDTFRFSDAQFGLINGIFYLGYCAFALPSNLLLERFGAKRWLSMLLLAWGLMTMLIAWSTGFSSFAALRFLLGVAEAGSYPAILLCLTYWFPPSRRATALALFSLSQPAANVIGALAAGWLLRDWHGLLGQPGWEWLFIVEGGAAVLLTLVILALLPDRPATARWLSPAERALVDRAQAAEAKPAPPRESALAVIARPGLWLLVATYFCYIFPVYGLGAWLPKMMREIDRFADFDVFHISLVVAVPAVLAAVPAIWWARRSDRLQERCWHAAIPALICTAGAGVSCVAMLLGGSSLIVLAGLLVTAVVMTACAAPFWAIAGQYLPQSAAAAGIALINCLGCLGGFAGPYILGWFKDLAKAPAGSDAAATAAGVVHGTAWGMGAVACSLLLFALLSLACRRLVRPGT